MKKVKIEGAHINLPVQVPRWANYIAQDEDGDWWAYEYQPTLGGDGWKPNHGTNLDHLCRGFEESPDWQETLAQIVRE